MTLFWRKTVKELATQLDVIDELIHALVVSLEQLEQRERGCCGRTPHESTEENGLDRFHVSGTPPPTPPPG